MNPFSSKMTTVSRRLAALLAALALLAAMALPVYAEAVENTTADPQVTASEPEEITTSAEDVEESTEPADAATAGETTVDTVENQEQDEEPVQNDDADKTTMEEDSAENVDTVFDEDIEGDAEEKTESDTDGIALYADSAVQYPIHVYFAVPENFNSSYTVKFNAKIGSNEWTVAMPMTELGETYDGRRIFDIELTTAVCKYGGLYIIQFQYFEGETYKNEYEYKTDGWVKDSVFANKLFDAKTGEWVDFTPFDPTKHTAFAGQTMVFKNASDAELTNVTAHFYEKDESGELQEVKSEIVGNGAVGSGTKVDFTIPNEACSYIQFTAGENNEPISSLYNFYGQQVTGENEKTVRYDSENRYCYIYSKSGNECWGTPDGRILYFDATFSVLSAETTYPYSIPGKDGKVYYYLSGNEKTPLKGEMTKEENNLYSVALPEGYVNVVFAAYQYDPSDSKHTLAFSGDSTAILEIPDTLFSPCFYADTGDDCVYNSNENNQRGGYWEEVNTLHDAEKGKKGKTVVDVKQAEFKQDTATKYINSTLYDYYTDWELNGNNRDDCTNNFQENQRNWVPFRQFDQAVSDYYQISGEKDSIKYPIYTGHFQTDEAGGSNKFSTIADTLNLFGWAQSSNSAQYKKFMAANNSELDMGEGTGKYNYTFLGIAGNELNNGNILMNGTSNLVMPHFNEAFLNGDNSKNAKLGEVYHNVSFPFTKKEIFSDEKGVEYWWFDSAKTSLYLRQDPTTNKLYLGNNETAGNEEKTTKAETTDDNSKNVNAGSNTENVSTAYGFFPFNEHSTSANANTYNYGYGTKLEIPFTLTSDGTVADKDGKAVPIRYYFSGDDDVWVYIDGQLVLDIGGAHGKVSGIIDFDQTGDKAGKVTTYVSRVKYNDDEAKQEYSENNSGLTAKTIRYKFNSGSSDKHVNDYYYSNTVALSNLTSGTHTLTMYYMERGMWESNMAVAFNFPDHNELQVEKKVDLTGVNAIFKDSFQNRELFAFTIQNQATHYGTVEAAGVGNVTTTAVDLGNAEIAPATVTTGSGNIFKLDTAPDNTGQALHWYAQYTDIPSAYRGKRYGILTLKDTIDISNMKYLTFKLYVQSAAGQSTPSISNMYLELLDDQSKPKQKGGVNKASLSGTTYGAVTMAEDQWITVKLDLTKLTAEEGFNNRVKTIRFGCNYPRHIYLKDFTFTSAVPDAGQVGFTTQQDQIPDYGSATSGKLENAINARFTSNKTAGTQVVDKDGKFLLADGETVTFTDQFRRGSYISLNEELNDNLFDTSWTLYENDVPVTAMVAGSKVTIPSSIPSLKDVNSSGPDDGRTENKGTNTAQTNNNYSGQKPTTANTIVFRSYSNPDAEADAAFTKLKVKYINKVKTGSLTIKKEAASGETLSGTYTFTVTFTNVGGLGLESKDIVQTVKIQGTGETTITGIPLGTRFRVEETGQNDGSHLQGVTFTNCTDGAVIDNKQVHGTITAREDGQITTVTFTNTMHELFDLTLTKQWQDADNNPLTTNLPAQIYVQLQRKKAEDTAENWEAVRYPADSKLDYVTITPDNGGWHYSFAGLDRTDVSDTTNSDKPKWTYRVVEGTLGTGGKFTPLAEGKTILLEGNVYTVTGGEKTTGGDKNTSVTLINTLQNPKFVLDVTKKSAEDDGENGKQKLLAGVEFTLEKLDENGQVEDGYPKYGITDADGKLKLKGSDESASDKAFTDLEAGSYRLTETKTAEGYSLLSEPIVVTFTKEGTCTLNSSKIEVSTSERKTEFTKNADGSYTLALTVLNRKTPVLPHTGADAPSLWLLIGLPLAVAGLLILVFRYNKKGGHTR